jgi:hypothetical protein
MVQIMPNRSVIRGRALRVIPAADGWGAEVDFAVEASRAVPGEPDFLGAAEGSTIRLFAADAEAIEAGKAYTLTVSVLGGPGGERTVVRGIKRSPQRTGPAKDA